MDDMRNGDARVRRQVSHDHNLTGHLRGVSFDIVSGPAIIWPIRHASNDNSVVGVIEVKETNDITAA